MAVMTRDDETDIVSTLAHFDDEIIDAVRLTLTYVVELEDMAEAVGAAVRRSFLDLTGTDRGDIARWVSEAEPYVLAGIDEGSDLAAAYISEMTGVALAPAEIVTPEIAWDDPFLRTWHQISEGYDYEAAKDSGAYMADTLGHDAATNSASRRMSAAQKQLGIKAWRRVVTAKACEFCRVVSTQMYRSEKTATFGHHGCRCVVVPIFNEQFDTAKAINKARLKDVRSEGAVQRITQARERSRGR